MKAVPATTQVQLDGEYKLKREGVGLEWNVSDEAALEAALCLKGQGSVTVLTMGPPKLSDALKELLGRGADHALLLTDPKMAGADTYATAKALSMAVNKAGPFDLILCGRRAIDGETGQVPPMLAAALGLPCITEAEKIELCDNTLLVRRRLEKGTAVLRIDCPALMSICEYSYTLRRPGIMSLRRARDKQAELLSAADLSLSPEQMGLKGSLTKVVHVDTRFPGLRGGEKTTLIPEGVQTLLRICEEVRS